MNYVLTSPEMLDPVEGRWQPSVASCELVGEPVMKTIAAVVPVDVLSQVVQTPLGPMTQREMLARTTTGTTKAAVEVVEQKPAVRDSFNYPFIR